LRSCTRLCHTKSFREAIEARRDWASILRGAKRTSDALSVLERATELARCLSSTLPNPTWPRVTLPFGTGAVSFPPLGEEKP